MRNLRKEIAFQTRYFESNKERTLFLQQVTAEGCQFREMPNNETVIERGCKSISTDDMDLTSLTRYTSESVKFFTNSYCTAELCNNGDGRKLYFLLWWMQWNLKYVYVAGLKCYACEGSGQDDPCMIGEMNNDTFINNIVTCEPNEFCHILRTVTLLNATDDRNSV